MMEEFYVLITSTDETPLLNHLAQLASMALVLVGAAGVYVARNIPKRISDNELAVKKDNFKSTANSVKTVLEEELWILKTKLSKTKEVLDTALESTQDDSDKDVIENPLLNATDVAFPSARLLRSPENWMQYLNASASQGCVLASMSYDTATSALQVCTKGARPRLLLGSVRRLGTILTDSLECFEEAIDRVQKS